MFCFACRPADFLCLQCSSNAVGDNAWAYFFFSILGRLQHVWPLSQFFGICGEDPMIFDLKSFAEMPRFRDERLEKVRHGGDTMKPVMRTSWVCMMLLNVINNDITKLYSDAGTIEGVNYENSSFILRIFWITSTKKCTSIMLFATR